MTEAKRYEFMHHSKYFCGFAIQKHNACKEDETIGTKPIK